MNDPLSPVITFFRGSIYSTFTWNGAGGGTTPGSLLIQVQRIGNWVTMHMPAITRATVSGSNTALVSNTNLPAWAIPVTTYDSPIGNMVDNAGSVAVIGKCRVSTAGAISVFRDFANTAFTNGATAGLGDVATVTYYVGP